MQQFYTDYLSRLERLHDYIRAAFKELPQSALDWVPGQEMNSICMLVVHITGAERYWISDVAAQDPSGRVREAEFKARGLDAATLDRKLSDSLGCAALVLENLTLQDLERPHISPRDGQKFSVGWALAHALEHTALHVGHIQITSQLWQQQNKGDQ